MINILSPNGRINRLSFFLYQLAIIAISGLFLFVFQPILPILGVLVYVCSIIIIWVMFMLIIKRLHDIGFSGWIIVAYAIAISIIFNLFGPYVALGFKNIAVLYLLLKRGEEGWNIYGDDPLENVSVKDCKIINKRITPTLSTFEEIEIRDKYDVLQNKDNDILIIMDAVDVEPNEPYFVCKGNGKATLYYADDKIIILNNLSKRSETELLDTKKVLIVEVDDEEIVREHYVSVKKAKGSAIKSNNLQNITINSIYTNAFGNVFLPEGRVNRLHFLVYNVVLAMFMIIFVDTPLALLPIWLHITSIIKRLHDINKSGWLIIGGIGAVFLPLLKPSGGQPLLTHLMEYNVDATGYLLLSLYIISIFVLGCLEGTNGKNEYGEDPLEEMK